jgi:hypothetical protein
VKGIIYNLRFGRRTMPLFAQRYGKLFAAHASTRSLALALNDVIQPEVHKLYPGAVTPVFAFDTSSQSTLVMEHRSARRLCAFAEGLLHGRPTTTASGSRSSGRSASSAAMIAAC